MGPSADQGHRYHLGTLIRLLRREIRDGAANKSVLICNAPFDGNGLSARTLKLLPWAR
jgi:hypothetical protein